MGVIVETHTWTVDKTDNPHAVVQSPQVCSSGVSNRIHVWCKGLRVDATIRVTTFAPEAGATYKVGFVQILEYSKMKAHYGDGIDEWNQQTLPCYDSTNDARIPWYADNSYKRLNAVNQIISVTMQDYPTSHLDPYYHRPGFPKHGHALTHFIKYNKFNLYLILRKETPRYYEDTILKHLGWSTEVEIQTKDGATWAANMYSIHGYSLKKHDRSVSFIHAPITHRFDQLPQVVIGCANDHINEYKRDAHHHKWWPHH